MEVGLVQKIDIDDEMQQAYLDYAMSVIVARALPDARDGLKPVHRRILYAMYDMGLRPDSSYKKSARIVGEVLGKYHPHGDMAVYEAMARMAQDFSMRYMLVDGQGNFGSVDGDPPAAMRYTEARLQAPALDLRADINKNTVDFEENFDGTLKEPSVMPSAIPNLLVNGATGIAVGMSTSIPPHNLGEVVNALKFLLANWDKMDDIDLENLMQFIQGPDFPTGGVIIQDPQGDGLNSAYGTGRGKVTVQARAHLEEMERGRNRIIVTELPYMTNKASLIERIASLVREERLDGIADLRDESDRQGMRIVIELTRGTDPEAVLRNLYRITPMQTTFSIIMLALVDGEPRLLGLKQALRVYLEHRLEIIRRRSEFDLEKARNRAHILEGLRVALKNLDEVIDLIRKSADVETARSRLMRRFKLSEIQAQAILDMQLRRLASLERKKIEEEYKEILAQIKELESLLRSQKRMRELVANELQAVSELYGDQRRTQILRLKEGEEKLEVLTATDMTPEKTVWIMVSPEGLISRTRDDKTPRLSGRDVAGWLLQANTRDTLYLVCEQGETAALPMHAVPEADKPSEGTPIAKISALRDHKKLAAVFSLPAKGERDEEWFVLTGTRQGMVKKSAIGELPGPSANTFTLVRVNESDRLGWVRISSGKSEVLLATASGMAIRFNEEDVRPMGLVAAGVMGIKLQEGDELVGMELLPQPGDVFLIASDGSAKRVAVKNFPQQGRYGQGVSAWKLQGKITMVGMAVGKGTTRATVKLDELAPKSIRLDEAPLLGRSARSQTIVELKTEDSVIGLTVPLELPRPLAKSKQEATSPSTGAGGSGKTRKTRRNAAGAGKVVSNAGRSASGGGKSPASGRSAASRSRTSTGGATKRAAGSSKGSANENTSTTRNRKSVSQSNKRTTGAGKRTTEAGKPATEAGKPATGTVDNAAESGKRTPRTRKSPASSTTSASSSRKSSSNRAKKPSGESSSPANNAKSRTTTRNRSGGETKSPTGRGTTGRGTAGKRKTTTGAGKDTSRSGKGSTSRKKGTD
jgi:DNA gyrase subunit A